MFTGGDNMKYIVTLSEAEYRLLKDAMMDTETGYKPEPGEDEVTFVGLACAVLAAEVKP
jgi:hypothetical protein